jgi:inorganic triphosphatase YgiF
METEAKFLIPDTATFEQLLATTKLSRYRLEPAGVKRVHDRYLDTRERAILKSGYACRLRRQGGSRVATLKSLGSVDADSGIHQRAEYEVVVEADEPTAWPASPARDLVLKLSGGQSLVELFALSQERHLRLLFDSPFANRRDVAELSLDVVMPDFEGEADLHSYYELELELLEQGKDSDLLTLSLSLRERWGLAPVAHSKFERGLAWLD